MLNVRILLASALVAGLSAMPLTAAQAKTKLTYDAVKQYSSSSNTEKQRWTYRFSSSGQRDGNYALLPETFTDDNEWQLPDGSFATLYFWDNTNRQYPYVSANETDQMLARTNGCCGPVYLPPKHLFIDTGSQMTVLSFLAPMTGTISVAYSFTHIDCHGGNGINWYVDKNSGLKKDLAHGSVYTLEIYCDPSQYATAKGTIKRVKVKKGDRINFIEDNNGDSLFDSSAVTAKIKYQ